MILLDRVENLREFCSKTNFSQRTRADLDDDIQKWLKFGHAF
jgi:hypothetical protein